MNMDYGHWILTESAPPLESEADSFGFIYQITNLQNNKKYIGKKQIHKRIKRNPLKGKKRKRIEMVSSDWKTYTSSSNELNEDIKKLGKENFKFEILKWGKSKFDLAYYEAELQFEKKVLLSPEYYNGIINLRLGKPKAFR